MARKGTSISSRCIETAIERYGLTKGARVGARVAGFAFQWCTYIERHEGQHPENVNQFANWAGVPRQMAYRSMDEFRDLFPEHETPAVFVGLPLMGGGRGVPGAARPALTN